MPERERSVTPLAMPVRQAAAHTSAGQRPGRWLALGLAWLTCGECAEKSPGCSRARAAHDWPGASLPERLLAGSRQGFPCRQAGRWPSLKVTRDGPPPAGMASYRRLCARAEGMDLSRLMRQILRLWARPEAFVGFGVRPAGRAAGSSPCGASVKVGWLVASRLAAVGRVGLARCVTHSVPGARLQRSGGVWTGCWSCSPPAG